MIKTYVGFQKLKKYCEYLIEQYSIINTSYQDSGMYWRLKQFSTEGRVKDLIFKNTKTSIKIYFLNAMKNDILAFAKSRDIQLALLNFEEYEEKK